MTIFSFSKRKSIAILFGFLFAFISSRITVFLIQNDIGHPFLQYNVIGDYHIHHFTYGIIILAVIGFIALFIPQRYSKSWLYVTYGIGLGLIFDEFGIWLKLNPIYNEELSYFAVLIITILLIMSAFVEHHYRKLEFLRSKKSTNNKKRNKEGKQLPQKK